MNTTILALAVLFLIVGATVYILPNISIEALGQTHYPFGFLQDWSFSGILINFFGFGFYLILALIYFYLVYIVFANLNNLGTFNTFYAEILSLDNATIKKINRFTKKTTPRSLQIINRIQRLTAPPRKTKTKKKARTITTIEDDIPFI